MKAIILKPRIAAYMREIDNNLKALQEIVGGNIEIIFPFEDKNVCLIFNEEEKLKKLLPNRVILDINGNIIDIIYGNALICMCHEGELQDLTQEFLYKYLSKFKYPERPLSIGNNLIILKTK